MGVHRQPILEKDGTLWWGIAAGLLFTAEFIFVYRGLELPTNRAPSFFAYFIIPPFIDLRRPEFNHFIQ